jgi:hypothetical protein
MIHAGSLVDSASLEVQVVEEMGFRGGAIAVATTSTRR